MQRKMLHSSDRSTNLNNRRLILIHCVRFGCSRRYTFVEPSTTFAPLRDSVKNRIGFAVSTVCGTDSELGAWTAIYGERCINRIRYSADVYAGKGEKLSRFKIFAGLSTTPYPRPANGYDANNVTIIHLGRPTPNPYGIIPSRFVFFVPYVGLSRSINNIEFGHDKNDLKSHYCFFSSFFFQYYLCLIGMDGKKVNKTIPYRAAHIRNIIGM